MFCRSSSPEIQGYLHDHKANMINQYNKDKEKSQCARVRASRSPHRYPNRFWVYIIANFSYYLFYSSVSNTQVDKFTAIILLPTY